MKRRRKGLFARFLGLLTGGGRESQPPAKSQGDDPAGRLLGVASRDAERLRALFAGDEDLVVRPIPLPNGERVQLLFLEGMVSKREIAEQIIAPLLQERDGTIDISRVSAPRVGSVRGIDEVVNALTLGQCVLLRDGRREAITFGVEDWSQRQIDEASSEPTVRGPREAFTEDLATNMVMIRRRLRTATLRSKRMVLGRRSRTQVAVLFLDGIARDEIVREVHRRLQRIDIDAVLDSNYIEELISDNPLSPLPSLQRTERPDRVVANLLEGQVAVLVDGSPVAVLAPTTFLGLMQSSEDYYLRFHVASFARLVRWLAAIIGLISPSIYVAILSYHHELIPTPLLFTIASGRTGVPFPPVLEALLMEMAFEVLREAGLRMPRQIGPALSIVGVLVIGDAAVRAGLVSPLMIVVVGMTAIATFALPSTDLANSVRLLRFPMMILAGSLGLFGVFFGVMLMGSLVISARSFGVPYLTPLLPIWTKGLKDAFIRAPIWMHRRRLWYTVSPDEVNRQGKHWIRPQEKNEKEGQE